MQRCTQCLDSAPGTCHFIKGPAKRALATPTRSPRTTLPSPCPRPPLPPRPLAGAPGLLGSLLCQLTQTALPSPCPRPLTRLRLPPTPTQTTLPSPCPRPPLPPRPLAGAPGQSQGRWHAPVCQTAALLALLRTPQPPLLAHPSSRPPEEANTALLTPKLWEKVGSSRYPSPR